MFQPWQGGKCSTPKRRNWWMTKWAPNNTDVTDRRGECARACARLSNASSVALCLSNCVSPTLRRRSGLSRPSGCLSSSGGCLQRSINTLAAASALCLCHRLPYLVTNESVSAGVGWGGAGGAGNSGVQEGRAHGWLFPPKHRLSGSAAPLCSL